MIFSDNYTTSKKPLILLTKIGFQTIQNQSFLIHLNRQKPK